MMTGSTSGVLSHAAADWRKRDCAYLAVRAARDHPCPAVRATLKEEAACVNVAVLRCDVQRSCATLPAARDHERPLNYRGRGKARAAHAHAPRISDFAATLLQCFQRRGVARPRCHHQRRVPVECVLKVLPEIEDAIVVHRTPPKRHRLSAPRGGLCLTLATTTSARET